MANGPLLPGGVVAMTGEAARRLMASGNGDAALLYLYLLSPGADPALVKAGGALKWDGDRLSGAYDALVSLGLAAPLPPAAPPVPDPLDQEPPEYTAEDVTAELSDPASSFPGLVTEVQRRLGRVLSTADLKALYTLYDYLALPAEVICLLVNWSMEEYERKYGPGRRPRLSQIRKEGFAWRRMGLDTAEAAEAYLKKQTALHTREGAVLAMLGVTGRPAVEGERRYIAAWVDMGFPDEAIRLAYERTVLKKQSMSWPYMNSILKSWHQKGLHTPEQIAAGDAPGPRPVPKPGEGQESGKVNDEIRWMRDFLSRQDGGEGGKGG